MDIFNVTAGDTLINIEYGETELHLNEWKPCYCWNVRFGDPYRWSEATANSRDTFRTENQITAM